MSPLFYSPVVLGKLRFGKKVVAGDPYCVDSKFDTARLHSELWQNAKFDVVPGEWLVLKDRIPLNEVNQEFLSSGDEEIDAELREKGASLYVLIHESQHARYSELIDSLCYGVHVNIESGRVGFCDERARHSIDFFESFTGEPGQVVAEKGITFRTDGNGPQPLYVLWDDQGGSEKAIMMATDAL